MARSNKKVVDTAVRTHEGARAERSSAEQQLMRTVMSCMLFEDTFYEKGNTVANRLAKEIAAVSGSFASQVAFEARKEANLRHVPLYIAREMARLDSHKPYVADTLFNIINRPDELTEFMSIYWKEDAGKRDKQSLSAQVKKGLGRAFTKFNEYQLQKYNQLDKEVKLKDVLFLVHPRPKTYSQQEMWDRLVKGELATPDTWEVLLSKAHTPAEKRAVWEQLIEENKLGAMALVRNLRNMEQVGVEYETVQAALATADIGQMFPYRFISAAKHAPTYAADLEQLMLRSAQQMPKLNGHTVVCIDISGSMQATLSRKSEVTRWEAGTALGMICREMAEDSKTVLFGSTAAYLKGDPRGFTLYNMVAHTQRQGSLGHGTNVQDAVVKAQALSPKRIIVVTDEQSATDNVKLDKGQVGYIINTAPYAHGLELKQGWTRINGFSDRVLDWINLYEQGRA